MTYYSSHVKRSVGPTDIPISVSDTKEFLRIEGSSEDSLIEKLIKMATEYAEWYMEKSIMPQKWQLYTCGYVPRRIYLNFAPVVSIDSITLFNNSSSRTLSAEEYMLNDVSNYVSFDGALSGDRLSILYNTGYQDINDIPQQILNGILHHVAAAYYNRTDTLKDSALLFSKNIYNQFRELKLVL